jgi:hypothetical protein
MWVTALAACYVSHACFLFARTCGAAGLWLRVWVVVSNYLRAVLVAAYVMPSAAVAWARWELVLLFLLLYAEDQLV